MTVNDFSFSDSDYRFTDPVRYFTSTDPYYWEIDNIPLKQLQENDLWLKDQIEDGFKNFRVSFGREDFKELQPYSNSRDNIIKVRPGRYSARINDAAINPRLQILEKLTGYVFSEPNKWRFATYAKEELANNIEKIVSEVADDALFMNGLVERVFTYATKNAYEAFGELTYFSPTWKLGNPLLDLYLWPQPQTGNNTNPEAHERHSDVSRWNAEQGMRSAQFFEQAFAKYWRGVSRISIVDVPEDLEIEVPAFDQRDFDYVDADGVLRENNNASVRIDLLFIYSKPVDASSVKIKGSNQASPRTITEPVLGLVRGAGVLLRTKNEGSWGEIDDPAVDAEGNIKILASPADQANTNGGFKSLNVHGSFPSPDDLMNIAPLLLEGLEEDDPRLVGQSVLPVAYVVVRRDAASNELGQQILTNNDIIDIRPLLRTTELTYNERAGLAASVPQISISNPVVSDYKLRRATEDIGIRINEVERRIQSDGRIGRIVGGGMIKGGTKFGPEGALRNYYIDYLGLDGDESYNKVRETLNLTDFSLNWFPEWEVASWVPSTNRGEFCNDYVYVLYNSTFGDDYGARSSGISGRRLDNLAGPDALTIGRTLASDSRSIIFFCKKTIQLDTQHVPWMNHYTVQASLRNCVPTSSPGHVYLETAPTYGHKGASNIWVEQNSDKFTIYCSWVGMNTLTTENDEGVASFANGFRFRGLAGLRDDPRMTAGFSVISSDLLGHPGDGSTVFNTSNVIVGGICMLPTVEYTIIGFPRHTGGYRRSSSIGDTTITLR